MLGLPRHTVQIVPYQPAWAIQGAEACERLRAHAGPCLADVQHVGSTAVPGLAAKPILDIALALHHSDVLPSLQARLHDLGYLYRGDHGEGGGHLWVMAPEPHLRSQHVHGVLAGSRQWHQYLQFRDALRAHAPLRQRYAQLKHRLAQQFADDRPAYTAGKAQWIEALLATPPEGPARQATQTPLTTPDPGRPP
jgi:GrpB-like predicted nucleotidyltransferase (UPF0157 family)